jgi:hypothetical protein
MMTPTNTPRDTATRTGQGAPSIIFRVAGHRYAVSVHQLRPALEKATKKAR